jgi:hypothetical protein
MPKQGRPTKSGILAMLPPSILIAERLISGLSMRSALPAGFQASSRIQ